MHWSGGWGKKPNMQGPEKGREGRNGVMSPVGLLGQAVGTVLPYDAYLLHGRPELALEVLHLHLDAHTCREHERGGARPDGYLGKEETVRAEKNRIHLKRESLSVAVAVGRQAWAGGNDGVLVTGKGI